MKLTLFFSKNISLHEWDTTGMFEREIAIYQQHKKNGLQSCFITYDRFIRKSIRKSIPLIGVAYNKWRLPNFIYYSLLPVIQWRHLIKTNIIKTNQVSGSQPAIQASGLYNKPLLARCGYLRSVFMENKYGPTSRKTKRALKLENRLFTKADAIIVTTEAMKTDIIRRLPNTASKINILPNYVDTSIFKPKSIDKEYDLIFIGRFSEQKNLNALLEAITNLGCTALIIGNGSNKNYLIKQFSSQRIHWKERVANSELPNELNKAKIFILPSLYEGHPKVLVEAMACGCAIIGTDVPGIKEVLINEENGIVTSTDSRSIERSIKDLLNDEKKRIRLGETARKFAINNYSLKEVAKIEQQIITKLIKKKINHHYPNIFSTFMPKKASQ